MATKVPHGPHVSLMIKLMKMNSGKYATASDITGKFIVPGLLSKESEGEETKSKQSKKGVWEEAFIFYVDEKETKPVTIELWKKSLGKEKLVGTGTVSYHSLEATKYHNSLPVPISKSKSGKAKQVGELSVTLKYEKVRKLDLKKAEQQAQQLLGDMSLSLSLSSPKESDPNKLEPHRLNMILSSVGFEEEIGLPFSQVSVNDVYCLSIFFRSESGDQEVEFVLPTSMRKGGEFHQGPVVRANVKYPNIVLNSTHALKVSVVEHEEKLTVKFEGKSISVHNKKLFFLKGGFKLTTKDIMKGIKADVPNFHEDKEFEVTGSIIDPVQSRDVAKLKEYLQKGHFVDETNDNGDTALQVALIMNCPDEIINLLVDAGANPTTKNRVGDSAIDLANKAGRKDILSVLNRYYM